MSDAESQAFSYLNSSIHEFIVNGNVEAARDAFNSFDKNHDNRVYLDEVWEILSMQVRTEPAEVYAKVEAVYKASDADSTLDFEEFQVFLRTGR
jgi:Ca2+-binding EF-hand superfamily protein